MCWFYYSKLSNNDAINIGIQLPLQVPVFSKLRYEHREFLNYIFFIFNMNENMHICIYVCVCNTHIDVYVI